MSSWIIGDIQGCYDSLVALLKAIAFDPLRDRLLLVGDLVNRGPRSLEVLRWARLLAQRPGQRLTCVLGNHDLHLLACAAGVLLPRRKDTIVPILEAPDRDELVGWLRCRPLLHQEDELLVVHAGLHPDWSAARAGELAQEVEAVLAGPDWAQLLAAWRRGRDQRPAGYAARWHDGLRGEERLVVLLDVFTRMRCLHPDGRLAHEFAGPPEQRPRGTRPWYAERAFGEPRVYFGHWAAHGVRQGEGWTSLDSGCVWGRTLSALCLEDRRVVQQPAVERRR